MNIVTEKELKELREKLLNKIEDYVLSYHGFSELDSPIGSGTFVKFSIASYVVYGILTVAHVVKKLKFGLQGQPSFIGLSKLQIKQFFRAAFLKAESMEEAWKRDAR